MSYRYGFVIYGTYVTEKAERLLEKLPDDNGEVLGDAEEVAECLGFTTEYSAGGPELLAWLGSSLGPCDTFEPVNLRELASHLDGVSDELKTEVEEQFNALPEKLRKVLPPLDVYIFWADS